MTDVRFCGCGAELIPGENWYPSDAKRRTYLCKACRAARVKVNPNAAAYQREWYKKNRDAVLAQQREYQTANRDSYLAYRRQYQVDNRKKLLDLWHLREARKRANGPVERIDRRAVWGRDEGHCRIGLTCGGAFVPFEEMQLDHVIPIARGGPHSWANVQTSCEPCNRAKGARVLVSA